MRVCKSARDEGTRKMRLAQRATLDARGEDPLSPSESSEEQGEVEAECSGLRDAAGAAGLLLTAASTPVLVASPDRGLVERPQTSA